MIAHIVLFQPKKELSAEATQLFVDTLTKGFREIPGIRWVRVGKKMEDGVAYAQELGHTPYSHAAVLEFSDRDTFVRYLEHPAHIAIGRQFWEACASTLILDVQTVDPKTTNIDDILVK
jgi:hypothetical protein